MLPSRKLAAPAAVLITLAAVIAVALLSSGGAPAHHPQATAPMGPRLSVALRMPSLDGHRPQLESRPQVFARHRRTRRFGTAASPVTGETLATTTGTWTGNPTSYAYQWEDCDTGGANCIEIATATASSYTIVSSDIGDTIRVAVTASNAFGFATQSSAQTGVVTSSGGAAPANTVAPAVTGTATQGSVLTTTKGTWSNSPTSFTYQWQDCDAEVACTDISGASGTFSGATATYTLAAAQVNHTVRATVTATNVSGSGSAFSNSTAGVASTGAAGGTWSGTAETGAAGTVCDYWVATGGSNAHAGTGSANASAWQTADFLFANLPTGKVGCFEAGTFGGSSDQELLTTANVTITAAPGASVVLQGHVVYQYQATGSTLSYLNLDEDYQPSLDGETGAYCSATTASIRGTEIDGNNDNLTHNNIYQSDAITANRTVAIGIGWNTDPTTHNATGISVAYNRIHDFGNTCGHGHGIYVENAKNSSFYDNWIYADPTGASGIQFFDGHASPFVGPHDDTAYSNVMDNVNTGALLFGETSSYANLSMTHNVLRSVGDNGTDEQHHVRSGFQANAGIVNNSVSFTNSDGTSIVGTWPCNNPVPGPGDCGSPFAVQTSGLITSSPQFADASSSTTHDYRVSASSPAASWGMWDGDFGTATAVIGTATVGPTAVWLDANFKRSNCVVAGASGTVSRVTAYLSPTGVAGTQKLKAAVYASSSGALLGQSSELTFASTNSAGWYDLTLTAPISVTSGTTYCPALLTGTTTQVAAVNVATGGTLYYNANTYTSGPSDPFGSSSTGSQTMSIFMVAS